MICLWKNANPSLASAAAYQLQAIAEKRTRGAWYRQWRLVSLDGSTLDVADTVENEQAFGRPGASRGSGAIPGHNERTQARSGSSEFAMVRRSPARAFR